MPPMVSMSLSNIRKFMSSHHPVFFLVGSLEQNFNKTIYRLQVVVQVLHCNI
jgi:hypothetical protein